MSPREPLWLPPGSVRAILALSVMVPITIIMLRSGIAFSADQVIGLASLILSAYFISKGQRGNAG